MAHWLTCVTRCANYVPISKTVFHVTKNVASHLETRMCHFTRTKYSVPESV